jgi:DNA-binding NarL/FixJ family response regulator
MKAMKLIIADGNELVRIGLSTLFKLQTDIEVIAESTTGKDLLDQVKCFPPDIILLDYTAKGFEIDIVPKIFKVNPSIQIVSITNDPTAQSIIHALRAGVRSCVKKDCDLSEIVDAVNETFSGNAFFCGEIVNTIRKSNINIDNLDLGDFSCEPIILSERELEIAKWIAEGSTNQEIAEALFLSAHTVNTHRKNLMAKLGVKNTAGIVLYAVKMNLVSPNKFLFAQESLA